MRRDLITPTKQMNLKKSLEAVKIAQSSQNWHQFLTVCRSSLLMGERSTGEGRRQGNFCHRNGFEIVAPRTSECWQNAAGSNQLFSATWYDKRGRCN